MSSIYSYMDELISSLSDLSCCCTETQKIDFKSHSDESFISVVEGALEREDLGDEKHKERRGIWDSVTGIGRQNGRHQAAGQQNADVMAADCDDRAGFVIVNGASMC